MIAFEMKDFEAAQDGEHKEVFTLRNSPIRQQREIELGTNIT